MLNPNDNDFHSVLLRCLLFSLSAHNGVESTINTRFFQAEVVLKVDEWYVWWMRGNSIESFVINYKTFIRQNLTFIKLQFFFWRTVIFQWKRFTFIRLCRKSLNFIRWGYFFCVQTFDCSFCHFFCFNFVFFLLAHSTIASVENWWNFDFELFKNPYPSRKIRPGELYGPEDTSRNFSCPFDSEPVKIHPIINKFTFFLFTPTLFTRSSPSG